MAAIVGFALAGSFACGDDGGGAEPAADCTQIAMTGNRTATDGLADVSVLRVDRSEVGESRLLTGDWVATDPSLSPDGRQVVVVRADGDYESSGPGATELWIMGTDGSAPRQLTSGQWQEEPAWSPDGTQIAYSAYEDAHRTVAVVPAAGGVPRTVVDVASMSFRAPAWSPDGGRLAVVGDDEEAPYRPALSVWTVEVDGTDLAQVGGPENTSVMAASLDWHPDGESLLVSRMASLADGSIAVVDSTTGVRREVADDATLAVWSPDGDGVYYATALDDGRWRLTYGVIEDDALVPDRPVGPDAAPLYPQYGLDAGACPPAG